MKALPEPVVILGAGINGAALARELALSAVPVVVIDRHDIASGTTAYSSRLIHGGLRYLEYAEFDLVRESLGERTRWLRLAPHLVHPLRLFIPVRRRLEGLTAAAGRFLRVPALGRLGGGSAHRGLWAVRMGLWLYDRYARDPTLPRAEVHRIDHTAPLPVDPQRYRWLCAFSDAQLQFPERFTVELLADAQTIADRHGIPFSVLTYHEATWDGRRLRARPLTSPSVGQPRSDAARLEWAPSAVVNATGAWVDETLAALGICSPRLMGGTKGSHFITHDARLRQALGGRAIYAEAADGRPIFVLPFGQSTLVGTTDEPYTGDPADAVASEPELEYLLAAVNELFRDVRLTRASIDLHYAGVRPLPKTNDQTPAAITRRHWLQAHPEAPVPTWSIIGGKLTTCRSLAEDAARTILKRLDRPVLATSSDRPLPGGCDYPADAARLMAEQRRLAAAWALSVEQVAAVWTLFGTRTNAVLQQAASAAATQPAHQWQASLPGVELPRGVAGWTIEHEWASRLDDLVERRLMLLYHPHLTRACLATLAGLLVEAGRLPSERLDEAVDAAVRRLATHFGKQLAPQVEAARA